jgi:predicted DCC family thiol-disulfide oxidoreductase YuxK
MLDLAESVPSADDGAAMRVLLFDGECGLCARSVQFVLRHERAARRHRLSFAALQGSFGQALLARYPALRHVDSVIWYAREQGVESLRVRSDAVALTLQHTGGMWSLAAAALRLVPRVARDWGYDFVAARRTQWVGRSCVMPTPEQRTRFLP